MIDSRFDSKKDIKDTKDRVIRRKTHTIFTIDDILQVQCRSHD